MPPAEGAPIIHAQRLQGEKEILECSIAPQLHKRSKPSAHHPKENLQDSVFFSFVHVWRSTALVGPLRHRERTIAMVHDNVAGKWGTEDRAWLIIMGISP